MTRGNSLSALSALVCALLAIITAGAADEALEAQIENLNLPPGFEIDVFAEVPGARSLAREPASGTIAVGTWSGKVYGAWDRDGNGAADAVTTLLEGLKVPNGVAFHGGYLYVAEQHRIVRYAADGLTPDRPIEAEAEVVFDRLPDKVHHGWRYVGFGSDGMLYVTVGVACNICDFEEPEGTILRMDPDGGNVETFAHGIRNSVGFGFHPTTGVLHFTDNGTDDMGDNEPPCEFNAAPEAGMHFGFPYYAGGHARHPDWADKAPPQEVAFPVFAFQAHTAPLGVAFYTGEQFPEQYRGDAFVAQHGSWNRSIPIGYRIKRILFDDTGTVTGHEVFIDGWLDGALAWGRPVDLLELPDGTLLISDDHQGVLYRVRYTGERPETEAAREQARADLATAGRFKAGICTTCHGGNGIALFPTMPNLAGQPASYTEAQLRAFRDGERTHPLMQDAVRHLTDADIEAVAAFYATMEPVAGDADPELAARGQPLYEGEGLARPSHACAVCHGPDGEGNAAAGIPALRGQHADYTLIALRAYATGERWDPTGIMEEIARSLSEDQMLALAAYAENLSGGPSGGDATSPHAMPSAADDR